MQCSATPQSSCPGIGVLVFAFAYRSQKNWTLSSCRIHRSWRTSTLGHKCWLVMSSPMRFDRFDKYVSDLATSTVLHSKLSQTLWPSTGIYRDLPPPRWSPPEHRGQEAHRRRSYGLSGIPGGSLEETAAEMRIRGEPETKLNKHVSNLSNLSNLIQPNLVPVLHGRNMQRPVMKCYERNETSVTSLISEPDIIQSRPRRMLARVCQRCDVLGDG